jgi:acyl-CoA hydrolase
MTSSARPISAFGTMRPSALAVLRLITNSYLVGACIECDFKIPSRIGEVIDLTLLVEDIGRSSLAIAIVCHRDNIERLHVRMVTAMMSLETKKAVSMPHGLREAIEFYRRRTAAGAKQNARENYDTPRCSLRRKSTKALSAGRIWRRLG